MRRITMSMQDWVEKLDGFLTLNDRDILDHAGKVSHQIAKQMAEQEYDKFHQQRLSENATDSANNLDELSQKTQKALKDKPRKTQKDTK